MVLSRQVRLAYYEPVSASRKVTVTLLDANLYLVLPQESRPIA